MAEERWLVAGLGNPGATYARNRHNAGFLAADVLAGRAGARFRTGKFRAAVAPAQLAGRGVLLAKPVTFMNDSGAALAGLSRYYRVPPERLLVIHDELDLPFTSVRLKLGGGDGGHNGLRSVTAALGTRDYYRVRVGIGRPPGRMDPAVFVLRDFGAAERDQLPWVLDRAADAAEQLIAEGLAAAQNAFHGGGAAEVAAP
jgi:PTH1 family peptidyl-tRNA hydrolase